MHWTLDDIKNLTFDEFNFIVENLKWIKKKEKIRVRRRRK